MPNTPPIQNQTQPAPDLQPANTPPVTQTRPEPMAPKKKAPLLLISFIVLLLSVTGVLGYKYYEVKQQLDNQQPSVSTPLPSPQLVVTSPTPVESPQLETPKIPANWVYKADQECNTQFPIPPREKPYIDEQSSMFWDFPRGAIYPIMLSKIIQDDNIQNNPSFSQSNTMYASEMAASGYIPAAVSVSCVKNTTNLNNQSMLKLLEENLQKYNSQNNSERMEAGSYTISSSKTIDKWGQSVVDLKISEYYQNSGGEPYTKQTESIIFATPTYLYEIKVFGMTEEAFVIDTANQIFDNLKF